MIVYRVEKKGRSLLVHLSEKGSRRVLYFDTLKTLAKESDKEALTLLVKLHRQVHRNLDTISFQKIEVPALHAEEALALMGKTGRMVYQEPPPLDSAPIAETPPVRVEKPLVVPTVLPLLILKDHTGCFANLWMDYGIGLVAFEDFAPNVAGVVRLKKEEIQWEKDLLEAGFIRKMVNDTHYFCPSDRVKGALQLLIEVGWKIETPKGVAKSSKMEIREEKGRLILKGAIRGLLDPQLQMSGAWEGDTFCLKKSRIGAALSLLSDPNICWEENLRQMAEGLKNGASFSTISAVHEFKAELLPYQQKGVDWLCFLHKWGFSALLADEMGLGKTVQVLAFLATLRTNLPVLIVAPTSLLFNWRGEIARFIPSFTHFELISYAQLRQNEELLSAKEYEAIVLDESNAIKTATTQTARAACKLKARFKICLSGTPMENRPDEIWSQFHFLMPDLIERNFDTLKQQIRPFILRRCKEDVQIDLPEKIEQIVWIEMDGKQKEIYETYRQGLKLDGATRMQVLEAILRLRQICCDPRLVGGEAVSAKLQQLVADVSDALAQNRKVLIFSQFSSMLKWIQREFPGALLLDGSCSEKQRAEMVHSFQSEGGNPLFLLSLKAGGVGLNLTAADYVFLFDPWWNEAVERQAIDRAHRIGQKKTVVAKRYITVGSIEEKMLQLKGEKQHAADQLLDLEGFTQEDLLRLI